jgi:protein-L-isoaspartate(D-aspartate) O-methyltransferase
MTSERTRMRMIELLRREGIVNERVLGAMAEIPRHAFVDEGIASRAYEDTRAAHRPRPDHLQPDHRGADDAAPAREGADDKVLEIGTGCGYQTAVLAQLVKEVYTLERIAPLMDKARRHLRDLRFYNVRYKHVDGHAGYPRARRTTASSWRPRPRTCPSA